MLHRNVNDLCKRREQTRTKKKERNDAGKVSMRDQLIMYSARVEESEQLETVIPYQPTRRIEQLVVEVGDEAIRAVPSSSK